MKRYRIAFAAISLAATASAQQANLKVDSIDTSAVVGDWQALTVSGLAAVDVANNGNGNAAAAFEVLLFEDRDGNHVFGALVDTLLGSALTAPLSAGATATVNVPLSGAVTFRDNLLHAFVDASGVVAESDENDNVFHTGLQCSISIPPGQLQATLEWSWTAAAIEPNSLNVMMTPAVVDLTGDGVPEVIFGSTASTGGGWVEVGVLRALDGASGALLFTQNDPNYQVNTATSVAVGDIDNDGRPEIVACDSTGARLICFEHDGAFKWRSGNLEAIYWGAPSIADLDEDGTPEIVQGRQALNAAGAVLWTGAGGSGNAGAGPISIVADIDDDGSLDVVAGNTVYSSSGAILYQNVGLPDGTVAAANFDADPQAEIVTVAGGVVRLLDLGPGTALTQLWSAALPGGGTGGPPTIADYDGDGLPEIGVAGASRYAVYEHTGALKWSAVTQDSSSNRTGSSVFDFNGDGSAEVVYRDELYLRIYNGSTGAVLFQVPMSSCTWHEYVLVADVDADGNAELVAVANNNCGFGPQRGVFVYGATNDDWVSTRRVWNEHGYHITNVNENGTIPANEASNWLTPTAAPYNNFRQNMLSTINQAGAPDLTASLLRADATAVPQTVTARIGNGGDTLVGIGLPVTFYDGDPSAGGVPLGTANTSMQLTPGQSEDVTLQLAGAVPAVVWVLADDAGGGVSTQNECDETNNAHSAALGFWMTCPPDFTDVWAGGIPAGQTDPNLTGVATWSDSCPLGAQLTWQDVSIVPNTPQNPGAPEVVITRRWTLNDGCGASQSCDQIITLLSPSGLAGLLTVDARPGACPNFVNVNSTGSTKIALVGTWLHDATLVAPASLRFERVDGVGRRIPMSKVQRSFQDLTRPYYGAPGSCHTLGADGHADAVFTLPNWMLKRAFLLNLLPAGTLVEVRLVGQLTDGTTFSVSDFLNVQ